MKNTIVGFAIVLLSALGLNAQQWNELGNNSITPLTEFLGTTDNSPIPFRTDNLDRMRLYENNVVNIDGGQTIYSVNQGGFLGLGLATPNFMSGGAALGPYSLFHLNGVNGFAPQQTGYRDWMRYGISFTHNDDFMYIGPRSVNELADRTRAVIAWADNDGGGAGPDDFSFLFSDGDTDESGEEECQEIMRLTGTGNVGIGNFQSNGLNQQPTHRLDVDGKVRIREVVPLTSVSIRDCILVGDDLSPPNDFEVRRINFTTDPDEYLGGDGQWHLINANTDCDWDTDANGIVTGLTTTCNTGNVGIGINSAVNYELDVFGSPSPTLSNAMGIHAELFSPNDDSALPRRTAVYGRARNGTLVFGGQFYGASPQIEADLVIGAFGDGKDGQKTFGLVGLAYGEGQYSIGVYGEGNTDAGGSTLVYGGYFVGNTVTMGLPITVSDMGLKQDISAITGSLEIIDQLEPQSYSFRTDEYSGYGLSEGLQYGFIAQEVEAILPSLVKSVPLITSDPETGVSVEDTPIMKGLNYQGFIPILTQGIKEQQVQIEELNARLEEMEARLADFELGKSHDAGAFPTENLRSDYELYQNRPNPFSDRTEIIWRMAEEAQATIRVQDQRGVQVSILMNGTSAKGLHSLEWDASDLPAGTYFYSLEVNGQLMVKRAVKLER